MKTSSEDVSMQSYATSAASNSQEATDVSFIKVSDACMDSAVVCLLSV